MENHLNKDDQGGMVTPQDKTIILTGAAGGVGSALALQFAQSGAKRLILVDKNSEGLQALKSSLTPYPKTEVLLFGLDLRSEDALRGFGDQIRLFEVDILVNNAGIVQLGHFETLSVEDFNQVLEVNFQSAVRLTRIVLPRMPRNNQSVIANISSGLGLMGQGGLSSYCASKSALIGFSEALGVELEGKVRVLVFCPALLITDFIKNGMSTQCEFPWMRFQGWCLGWGQSPERFASSVIRAIQKKQSSILMPWIVFLMLLKKLICPSAFQWLRLRAYQALVKRGFVR